MSTKRRLPWELLGAITGAGLASGREVASFFTQYGGWSWPGILLAVGTMFLLADAILPEAWRGRFPERLWRMLQTLLLTVTGGAMLCGAGEVAALTLPLHGAYPIGLVGTLLLGWCLANRTSGGLMWVSRGLMAMMIILIGAGLLLPGMQAVPVRTGSIPAALVRGVTWGGFNAALLPSILAQHGGLTSRERRRGVFTACLVAGLLLALCNAVLLRHPALLGETMPFIRLTARYGQWGYALGAVSLYLAILSTLTACMRGMGESRLALAGMLLASMAGFSGAVAWLYPILGGGCFLCMALARMRMLLKDRG